MSKNTVEMVLIGLVFACIGLGYAAGHSAGRQECPMAVTPKCDFVFRGDKLIKTICPDSLGRMP
jgi:hypothetical protein